MSTSTVEHTVEARLISNTPGITRVTARFSYDPADPFAVRVMFPSTVTLIGEEVCWAFSRDLLTEGMDRRVGEGDVTIRPYGYDRTVLEFHAWEGVAVVHVHSDRVRHFLHHTAELVEYGHEARYLDLDRELGQLLRRA